MAEGRRSLLGGGGILGRRSSMEIFQEALEIFPGGVNSPVRATVKPHPFYVERGEGPYLYTVEGIRLIDYVLGYGPLILGHRHPEVLRAVEEQLEKGWLYGAPADVEVELAKSILSHYPSADMVRFVNTGTEATMLAVRLARAYTGRELIVKFDGCYHGAHDYLLVGAGSAATHYGVPVSKGIPRCVAEKTLVARYNDPASVERIMREHEGRVAAIIVEPVAGNHGLIPPRPGFLEDLRKIADAYGSLLILDEIITGFRLGLGGAQERYGVRADITTLGKVIGGGFPIGAVIGPCEIMAEITPSGKVFNAGTFNAHPVSMAAGLATLKILERGEAYSTARNAAEKLAAALEDQASRMGLDYWVNRAESMLQIFFTKGPVDTVEDARRSDRSLYEKLHRELLGRGVFIPPSQFETMFTSAVHSEEVLDETLRAVEEAFKALVKGG